MVMSPNGWRADHAGPIVASVVNTHSERVGQAVVGVGVAVRPAVDGDRDDVARRIEAAGAEDARELIADVALEGLERRRQQVGAADAVLFLPRLAGRARVRGPCGYDRLVRRLRVVQSPRSTASVSAMLSWYIVGALMFATPSFSNARQLRERDAGVDERSLDAVDASASFCAAGSSGTRYGMNMFQHAITTARPRTSYSLPPRL